MYWCESEPPAEVTCPSPLPPACHRPLQSQAHHILGRRVRGVTRWLCPSCALEHELPAEPDVPPGAKVMMFAGRADWARPGHFRGRPSPRTHCVYGLSQLQLLGGQIGGQQQRQESISNMEISAKWRTNRKGAEGRTMCLRGVVQMQGKRETLIP